MRSVLFWLLLLVLIGSGVAGALYLLQGRPTLFHPDYGADCQDLLTPATEDAVDCVRVFYGTNRKVVFEGDAGPLPGQELDTANVVSEDGGELVLGRADIWLPRLIEEGGSRERGETPYLKGDTPEEDTELAKYVFITRITAAGTQYFFDELDTALIDNDSWSLLLFVHGFNTPFADALIRSAQLSVDLSRRGVFDVGVPVLFSWPSAGKLSLGDYESDGELSVESARYLEEFLDLLTTNADVDRINIVAHSMGNRVLTQALEDFAADYLERHGNSGIEFRIILVAADVDRDIFDATTGILDNLQANVTIYTSDADRALHASNLVNRRMRLGDTDGDKPYIRENEFYETVDATGVATELFGLGHNYYSDNPFILGDMLCAMAEANPEVRSLERRRYAGTEDGLEYFRVSPAIEPVDEDCSLFRDAYPITALSQVERDQRFDPAGERAMPPPPPPAPPPPPPTLEQAPAPEPRGVEDLPAEPLILFVEDRDAFDPVDYASEIIPALNVAPVASVEIVAHTDSVGSEALNLVRTQSWADQLAAYIANATGIDPALITAEGRGESQPAVATEDETDEPQNRRIEVLITYE